MNWNNGQLARHSRRSYSNDATRQKQYFAQAKRQKVSEPPKRKYNAEDFVPSYLEDLSEKLDRPWIDAKRQKEQKRRVFTLQEVSQTSLQTTQVRENHKCTQRARGPSSTMEQGDISIDAKRRKLLQQSDWSGVELQKPVMISYPETARSARKVQHHQHHNQLDRHLAKTSTNHMFNDTVIKIAGQEYHWSPGNNSIRTRHSKGHSATLQTPMAKPASLYDVSSTASKSFCSFVPESPCATRALQIGKSKACHKTQLQSAPHTSPSSVNEPVVKADFTTQYFHPQPIRRMPQSVYARLSDSVNDGSVALELQRASSPRVQNDGSSYLSATENEFGRNVVPETPDGNASSKALHSLREGRKSSMPDRSSYFEHGLVQALSVQASPEAIVAVHDGNAPKYSDPFPNSITTTDIHGIAEASHPGSRPSAPSYRGVMSAAPTLVNEAENIMWKQFVLGPGRPVLAESAEKCVSDTLDNEGTDSRSKFGINTKAVRAPTWNASKPDNASPVPDSRRRPGPTPAPAGPTPPLTISTEVPSMSLFNNPQTTSNNTATVYFREQGDRLEAMTASPTQAKDQLQPPVLEIQHMTSKPESTFHPPSLFVGRLAIRRSGGAGTVAAVTGAVETGQNGSPVDALNKAPSGRVMSRRRRNKRREIGRPDIRALPNIQGDPIEFTP